MKTIVAAAAMAAGVIGGAVLLAPAPAQAEIEYPWCAIYGGGLEGSNGTNCGFSTHQQCWDTVAGGRIGDCFENPRYTGAAAPARHKKRHRRD
ncbi:MAG TPA: DUF3551 domain-containing protein [Pseudolabrys sp.]|jgi:hypothetical protein|nr:DUF3551 domain-containing protein [Pseudolabrys sp.]